MKERFINYLLSIQERLRNAKLPQTHRYVSALKLTHIFSKPLKSVLNGLAVFTAFGLIVLSLNEPLRVQLAQVFIADDTEISQQEINDPATFERVSWSGLKSVNTRYSKPTLLTPEILNIPVPSIASLAGKIPKNQIDPKALDGKLLSSVSSQRLVAEYMANKYNLDSEQVSQYISHAVVTAKEVSLDPVLLIAVMSIESNFNPKAQSNAGAQGLMQVMTKVHLDKYALFGGSPAAFKPEANIRVGAYILKSFIALSGSLEGGLRYYVGGPGMGIDESGYVNKVLHERDELNMLLRGSMNAANKNWFSADI